MYEQNGIGRKLDLAIESIDSYNESLQETIKRLDSVKYVDSLPDIADGLKQLNRTLLWTHLVMIMTLSLFVLLLLLKDSKTDFQLGADGVRIRPGVERAQ